MSKISDISLKKAEEWKKPDDDNWKDESKTWVFFKSSTYNCEVCEGKAHEYWECPTKKRLDKWARKNGDSFMWGKVKYGLYYHLLSEEERERHKKLA